MRSPAVLIMLLVAGLAGCDKTPPEVVVAPAERLHPAIAAECRTDDPAWRDLPDADIRRAEMARNYRANKDLYRSVLDRRRVCRASLDVHFPPSPQPRARPQE